MTQILAEVRMLQTPRGDRIHRSSRQVPIASSTSRAHIFVIVDANGFALGPN
jgi:hypothetical protein